jgi:uncharacterized protein YndB with AHSA1/START domain
MPIVSSSTDVEARRITLVSELDATPTRVWDLWADPRRLERWWGPPGVPMTVEHHDLRADGQVRFHVDFDDGTRIDARFEVESTTPPDGLRFAFHTQGLDPSTVDVRIEPVTDAGTRMTITVELPTDAAMAQAVDIGFDQGLRRSVERLDAALTTDRGES